VQQTDWREQDMDDESCSTNEACEPRWRIEQKPLETEPRTAVWPGNRPDSEDGDERGGTPGRARLAYEPRTVDVAGEQYARGVAKNRK
jgi:hypothetical protein